MATIYSQQLARKLLPKLTCSALLAILLCATVFISGAYSHNKTASYNNLGPANLLDRPFATRRIDKTNVTANPPRKGNQTMARQPINRMDLETIQKGNDILQLQLEQALAKIEQSKMSRKTKTGPNKFPDHPELSKLSKHSKPQLPFLGKPNQTWNMRYPNMPLETNNGDVLQLNIQYPSRIYSSAMSRLNMIKTKFWGTRLQKWSERIFTWHSKPPVYTRHPPRGSRRTLSWAWSPGPWPPTCSLNTTMSRSRTMTWRWRSFHHGGNHFAKRRSEGESKRNQNESKRNRKSESQKRNIKDVKERGQQVKRKTKCQQVKRKTKSKSEPKLN
jgi:hypothetical protein